MDTLSALSLNWIDWSLLLVLLASMLVGLSRGFVFECLSLAGWVVAWIAAQWMGPFLAPSIPLGTAGSALNAGVAFIAVFVVALIVWAILAKLVRMVVHATPLSVIDRVMGGGFGLLRGTVLLLAVATLLSFTPAARSQAWQESRGADMLSGTIQWIKPMLPAPAAKMLPEPMPMPVPSTLPAGPASAGAGAGAGTGAGTGVGAPVAVPAGTIVWSEPAPASAASAATLAAPAVISPSPSSTAPAASAAR